MVSVPKIKSKLTIFIIVSYCVCLGFTKFVYSQDLSENPLLQKEGATKKNQHPGISYIGAERFVDGEELIMSLEVDKWRLAQVVGIKTENGIQVSFTEMIQALDFPIKSSSLTQYEGWFIVESNSFKLYPDNSTNNLKVLVNNQIFEVSSSHYQLVYSDLFIDLSLITQWFQLNPKVDFSNQRITIAPTKKLPIQLKEQRKTKRFDKFSSNTESTMPLLNRGYSVLSAQAIDLQSNINYVKNKTSANYTALGVREVLLHNTNFFLTGSSEEAVNIARLNISKQAVNGNLLGILDAKSYEFGDVTPIRVGNLATNRQSRGLRLSNVDLRRSVNNEVTNFTGAILPGWDVELYRNEILLDQRLDVSDGRYEFNDVALLYGTNQFELVFYGPQGQIERETETRILSPDTIKNTQFEYSVSLTQVNQALFKDSSIGTAANRGGFNLSGEYSTGFGESSRIKVGHENVMGSDFDSNLLSIGVNTSIFNNSLLNYSFAFNDLNETSFDVNFRTALGNQSVSALVSSRTTLNPDTAELIDASNLTLLASGSLLKSTQTNISHQSKVEVTKNNDNRTIRLTSNIGASFGRTYFFNGLQYIKVIEPDSQDFLFGNIGLQQNFGPLFGKFQLSYTNEEKQLEFTNASADLSWVITPSIRAKLVHNQSLVSNNHRTSLNVDWKSNWLRLSSRFTYSKLLGSQLGLFATMSFSGTPEYGEFVQSNKGLTGRGTLLVRVFLDANGNLVYDEGEELLKDVTVKSVQSRATAQTEINGVAELTGLIPQKVTDIIIAKSSIEDPFMMPVIDGISVIPREGNIDLIDFPVVNSSELDGTLYFENDSGDNNVAAYVEIGLFDKGELIYTTNTEFDGFFLFTGIKPGTYLMKISENSVKRHRISKQINATVHFPVEGKVLTGKDFILSRYKQASKYLVHHGSFPSSRAMEVYWQLNGDKLRRTASLPKITYDTDPSSKNLRLVLLKSSQQQVAREYCNDLLKLDINCVVSEVSEVVYPAVPTFFR